MALVEELFHGRTEILSAKSSAEIPYVVFEATDEVDVKTAILATSPTTYAGLLRKSVELTEQITLGVWRVLVRYETPDQSEQTSPEPVISFDSSGGTQHITQSIQTVSRYGPKASEELGGAIGYDGENVAGVDITIPVWNWTETHFIADEDLQQAAYYNLTGKVNSDEFRGYQEGEVLFLGVSGTKRGNGKWELTFKFAASPNQTNILVGSINLIAKKGWEYLWVQYGDDIDNTAKVRIKKPVAVYVEQVYDEGTFSDLEI